jgi:hypothetical protein
MLQRVLILLTLALAQWGCDMNYGEFDIGGLVPYARAELQSWRRPSGREHVFLHRAEHQRLWVKEPVLVKVREGALGIPWVETIEEDRAVHLRQVLEIAPTAAAALVLFE